MFACENGTYSLSILYTVLLHTAYISVRRLQLVRTAPNTHLHHPPLSLVQREHFASSWLLTLNIELTFFFFSFSTFFSLSIPNDELRPQLVHSAKQQKQIREKPFRVSRISINIHIHDIWRLPTHGHTQIHRCGWQTPSTHVHRADLPKTANLKSHPSIWHNRRARPTIMMQTVIKYRL